MACRRTHLESPRGGSRALCAILVVRESWLASRGGTSRLCFRAGKVIGLPIEVCSRFSVWRRSHRSDRSGSSGRSTCSALTLLKIQSPVRVQRRRYECRIAPRLARYESHGRVPESVRLRRRVVPRSRFCRSTGIRARMKLVGAPRGNKKTGARRRRTPKTHVTKTPTTIEHP